MRGERAAVKLLHGDCLDVMRALPENSVDSVVTDPPYGLSKDPDIAEVMRHWLANEEYSNGSGGFMGKSWDSFVPGPRYWREVLRVLKPGGVCLVFAGTRTADLMSIALRFAGFQIRDTLCWLYGSGFPKSHDIAKAIDKAAGVEREVVGHQRLTGNACVPTKDKGGTYGVGVGTVPPQDVPLTAPATPEAELWDGWGTALKPSWEPILLAMAPRDGTFANNALTWGVAGINVDGCRVAPTGERLGGGGESHCSFQGKEGWSRPWMDSESHQKRHAEKIRSNVEHATQQGRWPSNLLLSHSPGCVRTGTRRVKASVVTNPVATRRTLSSAVSDSGKGRVGATMPRTGYASPDGTEEVAAYECTADDCPIRMLDEQSGTLKSNSGNLAWSNRTRPNGIYGKYGAGPTSGISDTGGASRFFTNLDGETRFLYCPKASRREREAGLEGMEEQDSEDISGGSGTAHPKADAYQARKSARRNPHPTVKSLALMRWLCRLCATPTGGVVLDPFMGSGTTGVACVEEGRDFIGIEQNAEYLDIARARIAHAERKMAERLL